MFLFSFGKILEENEALLLIISFLSSLFSSEVLLDHMFFECVLQIKFPFLEYKYISYCSNSIEFSSFLF